MKFHMKIEMHVYYYSLFKAPTFTFDPFFWYNDKTVIPKTFVFSVIFFPLFFVVFQRIPKNHQQKLFFYYYYFGNFRNCISIWLLNWIKLIRSVHLTWFFSDHFTEKWHIFDTICFTKENLHFCVWKMSWNKTKTSVIRYQAVRSS